MVIFNKIDSAWAWRFLRVPPLVCYGRKLLIFHFLYFVVFFLYFWTRILPFFDRFRLSRCQIRIPRQMFVIIHCIDIILGLELSKLTFRWGVVCANAKAILRWINSVAHMRRSQNDSKMIETKTWNIDLCTQIRPELLQELPQVLPRHWELVVLLEENVHSE